MSPKDILQARAMFHLWERWRAIVFFILFPGCAAWCEFFHNFADDPAHGHTFLAYRRRAPWLSGFTGRMGSREGSQGGAKRHGAVSREFLFGNSVVDDDDQ